MFKGRLRQRVFGRGVVKRISAPPNLVLFLFSKLLYLVFIAAVGLAGYVVFRSDYFVVRETKVFFEGEIFGAEGFAAWAEKETQGRNILFLSEKRVAAEIKKSGPLWKEVVVRKRWPSKIEVLAKARRPVGFSPARGLVERGASPSAWLDSLTVQRELAAGYLVDAEGVVFAKVNQVRTPVILWPDEKISLGRVLNRPRERYLIDLVQKLTEAGFTVSLASVFGADPFAYLGDRTLSWFSMEKNLNDQVAVAKAVWEKYRLEGKKVAKIDLRFKNPVVEFK